ncbi:EAL domain-containing protein [Psychromonas sp. Urea-02u-13]|uniref:EAL domain-containing protein n=1 Tax=Psychromonas sp. Urea-02u-13 TaxID=2058326 RepID=UPI000C33E445|nr:EAL domain-containing protein [Psychromonas sp. Urea-02u-13]PKG39312.1 EAL domain-containing protein [Psychromonas sp. Urea-02u-13]
MSHFKHLNARQLLELMETKRYGAEYQPIVSTVDGRIFAYECLSRFYKADGQTIPPDLVYASLHDNPLSLFQVEYEQKKLQLSYAPHSANIFVNLDQDSYSASGLLDSNNPFVALFKNYNKANVIVELIENSELSDAVMSLSMIDNLSKNNISTAIDDLFNPQSMLSTSVVQMVDYIKLDKYVIKKRHSKNFMPLVNAMISYAHETGKKIILEGVETLEDLTFAKQIGADYVQGFLYKKLFNNVT